MFFLPITDEGREFVSVDNGSSWREVARPLAPWLVKPELFGVRLHVTEPIEQLERWADYVTCTGLIGPAFGALLRSVGSAAVARALAPTLPGPCTGTCVHAGLQ